MIRRISWTMIALGALAAPSVQAGPAAPPGVSFARLNRAATQVSRADAAPTQLAAHHCGRGGYYAPYGGGHGGYYRSGYRGGHGYGGYGYGHGGYGPAIRHGHGGPVHYPPTHGGRYYGGRGHYYHGGYPAYRGGSSFGLYIGF